MAVLRRTPPKTGFQTAIWAAKFGFLLAGIFSIAAFARIAIPYTAAVLASAIPRAWAALRSWLVPPYLFITVHLIIIVIWMLSDHKHHHLPPPWPADDKSRDDPQTLKPKDLRAASTAAPLLRNPSPEIWREISHDPPEYEAATPALAKEPIEPSPPSDASCLTTASEEMSTASSRLDIKKSIAPEPESVDPLEEEEAVAVPGLQIEENDSMDDTWKAIMEKSGSRSSRSELLKPAAADPEEMDRRFDDFIKKKKDEIRLQRLESDQRQSEMVNRALY